MTTTQCPSFSAALSVLIAIAIGLATSLTTLSAQTVELPYNPDSNSDQYIGTPDLLDFLPAFGSPFEVGVLQVDGLPFEQYLSELGMGVSVVGVELLSDTLLSFTFSNDSVVGIPFPGAVAGPAIVGCADATACNFDAAATAHYAALCLYADACGICDGPGAIYDCGCSDIPEGDCDCEGSQLDALSVCGGSCSADLDADGICDDGDDCIGAADACGICNGPGAIYDCGCSGIPAGDCDCDGGQLDALDVCGGGCAADADQDGVCDDQDPCVGVDSDGDGICDDLDDCEGSYDSCGVCGGPGPIYDCGCSDVPEGDCDCSGNQPDAITGDCQDYAADTDGDGLYDTLLEPCLNVTSYSYYGHDYGVVSINDRCWFRENLQSFQYANGDSIPNVEDASLWSSQSTAALCAYNNDPAQTSVYGLLYNGAAASELRGVCPSGWQVPSESEWTGLFSSQGGAASAGAGLKEAGTSHWDAPNTGATNASSFTALPSGERAYGTLGFVDQSTTAHLWAWSSNTVSLRSVRLYHDATQADVITISPSRGQALRCIRQPASFGCTDINFLEYSVDANLNDGSCSTPSYPGCTDAGFAEYDTQANIDNGSCSTLIGCSDTTAVSFDGYDYAVVAIGTQCWFRENLRCSHYLNGETILNPQDPTEWIGLNNGSIGAWVDYWHDANNGAVYGHLYNWYAVDDARGLCPSGWHVPSDDEWKVLELHLGMPASEVNGTGNRGGIQNVGGQLKEQGTAHWSSTNGGLNNNESGFTAFGSGLRHKNSGFYSLLEAGYFWSASPSGGSAWYRLLSYGNAGVYRTSGDQRYGFAIRCARD